MKAFISHSSKDKPLVKQIVDEVGEMRCEYDEYNFDFELNNTEIRRALQRADIFVLILSQNSIKSNFINEEIRAAFEARGAGHIKKVFIVSIDNTSYRSLPAWMQEINVAQHLKKPIQIARRIDTYLTELSLNRGEMQDFYLGRENDEVEMRKHLRKPKSNCPSVIHIVGNHGIGRRTFIKKALYAASPRKYASFIELIVEEYDGLPEIYRKLYDLFEPSNPLQAAKDLTAYNELPQVDKVERICSYIRELIESDIFPILLDFGGVLQDNGDYQPHVLEIVKSFKLDGRPIISFIQTRMMPSSFRRLYEKSLYMRLGVLNEEATLELLCLILQDLDIDYQEKEARAASILADGHPFNVNFIAARIADQGIDVTLADPSEIILMKEQRGNEFLRKVIFSEPELDIMRFLQEYRFCDLEFIMQALSRSPDEIVHAIRQLEDNCCIERRDRLVYLSPAIRDAVRRDKRIHRNDEWLTAVAARIVSAFEQYEAEDTLSINIIDSAIPEVLKSGKSIPYINNLILPSHLLRVGRSYYDKGKWSECIDFCNKAIELEDRLTMDAKVEVSRILGLALVRVNPNTRDTLTVVKRLRSYGTQTARRVAYFVEGFQNRRRAKYPDARDSFLEALKLGSENIHINRELSSVLCKMELFSDAEPYARSAYNRTKENPYIIDVLIESLEGKSKSGYRVDNTEISRLYTELELSSESSGRPFFRVREARRQYDKRDSGTAIDYLSAVLASDDSNISALYHRASFRISKSHYLEASNDIKSLKNLKNPEADLLADRLEAEKYIATGDFSNAKKQIDYLSRGNGNTASRLYSDLAKTISFAPEKATQEMRDWALKFKGAT